MNCLHMRIHALRRTRTDPRNSCLSWHWLCAPVRYSGHPVARWGHQTLAMPWRINCLHRTAMPPVAMRCTCCARLHGNMRRSAHRQMQSASATLLVTRMRGTKAQQAVASHARIRLCVCMLPRALWQKIFI